MKITRVGVDVAKSAFKYMRLTDAVVSRAQGKRDQLSRWVTEHKDRRHTNVAAVAIANKTVRIAWAMLRHGTDNDPELAVS